jgi:hypothetical protein
MVSNDIPDPEELLAELRIFIRVGVRPAQLPALPKLIGLSIVGTAAHGTQSVDRALALVEVLREAVTALGEGPSSGALELLLGLTPRSRGLLLKDRRDLAAEILGVDVQTWRRHWERPLLLELATELYRMESNQRIPIRVRPRRRAGGPVLHDLREGVGGKSLDRREAEARLFSLMYALRADLLAAARLQEEGHQPDDLYHIETALWRFALFTEAMARYTDNYSSAIVMAGNEVTVQEAAALLAWRPPLEDDELGLLRIILLSEKERGRDAFLQRLRNDTRAGVVREKWNQALFGGASHDR